MSELNGWTDRQTDMKNLIMLTLCTTIAENEADDWGGVMTHRSQPHENEFNYSPVSRKLANGHFSGLVVVRSRFPGSLCQKPWTLTNIATTVLPCNYAIKRKPIQILKRTVVPNNPISYYILFTINFKKYLLYKLWQEYCLLDIRSNDNMKAKSQVFFYSTSAWSWQWYIVCKMQSIILFIVNLGIA